MSCCLESETVIQFNLFVGIYSPISSLLRKLKDLSMSLNVSPLIEFIERANLFICTCFCLKQCFSVILFIFKSYVIYHFDCIKTIFIFQKPTICRYGCSSMHQYQNISYSVVSLLFVISFRLAYVAYELTVYLKKLSKQLNTFIKLTTTGLEYISTTRASSNKYSKTVFFNEF